MKLIKFVKVNSVFITLILLCALSQTSVAETERREFPEKKTIRGKSLILNGTGVRDEPIYHAKVYAAGLYLESKTKNARRIIRDETVKHLELKFLSRTRRFSVLKSWEEGFEKQVGADPIKYQPSIDKLKQWMTSVSAGDTFEFTYIPEKGLEVRVKNELKGVIQGEEFSRVFFSIWLGRDPVNHGLKQGLLGRERN